MDSGGWVASDATTYSLQDKRPDWFSLVSVAIAVEDISAFNGEYRDIVDEKKDRHGIKANHDIIKNEDFNRWCSDWERKDARSDIVTTLLQIESIDTIQITETSLHSQWVTVFSGEKDKENRIRSEKFIEQYLQPYYNLVAIWEYLRKAEHRPHTRRNVMTDDFSGKLSPAWLQVGEMSDELMVIPKGDQTYPLLSLADLVMEFVKQEVDEWDVKNIYEILRNVTPDDSAYVDSDAIDDDEDLNLISPYKSVNINTSPFYPNPTVYIDSGSLNSSTLTSLDFFRDALAFARKNGGCVKFFNESQDRDYMTSSDILICADGNTEKYSHYGELNTGNEPKIVPATEADEIF